MTKAALCVAIVLALAGCSQMEQYRFPQTQDKVPVAAIVAFSHKYPNDVITDITEEKMYDGKRHYEISIVNNANKSRTVYFTEDGEEVKGPL